MLKWEALKCTVGVECFLYTVYHTHTSTIYIHEILDSWWSSTTFNSLTAHFCKKCKQLHKNI